MGQQKRRIQTRTCVVCRKRRQHSELLRIVRTPEGRILFDKTGRMNGRGAYVCGDADHWVPSDPNKGIDRGRLRNALRTEINDSAVKLLSEAFDSHINE
jgi:uncharacterized protein